MKIIRKILATIKSGFVNAWTHKSNGLASILSIAAVSIMIGIVIIISLSVNILLEDVQSRVDEIEIYIEDDMTDEDIRELAHMLESRPEVSQIEFKDKEKALALMKDFWGADAYLLEGLEQDNPLERSFVVNVEDIENSDDLVEFAESVDGVSTVVYYQDTINRLVSLSKYVRLAGLIISLVLLIISIMIISNTVKLTVQTRSDEIQVMTYLGASDARITIPYIIEGIIFGLIGSLVSYVIVYYGYEYLYNRFNDKLYQLISSYMINPQILEGNLLVIFAMLGIVIGTVGSIFSAKRYLKV